MVPSSSQSVRALVISVALILLTAGITITTTAAQDPATSSPSSVSTAVLHAALPAGPHIADVAVRDGTRLAVDVFRPPSMA
jgi:hypothetical protein